MHSLPAGAPVDSRLVFWIAPVLVLQLFQELHTVELRVDDPALVGRGRARTVEVSIEADGFLDLWAESKSVDPFLRVEDKDGTLRAEDDDFARAGRPWISLEVARGTQLVVHVASAEPDVTGAVDLHLVRWTTSAEELELAARIEADLAEAKALHAQRDLPASRARVEALLGELSGLEPGRVGPRIERTFWEAEELGATLGTSRACIRAGQALLAIAERRYPSDHVVYVTALREVGVHSYQVGDFEAALAGFERAVACHERTLPEDDRRLQAMRSNVAAALQSLGRPAEARVIQEKVLEVLVRTLGPDERSVQATRSALANSLNDMGETARAEALLRECLAACERTLPPDDSLFENVHAILAGILHETKRPQEAAPHRAVVLERRLARLPPDHPLVLKARASVASCLILTGNLVEARAQLEATLGGCLRAGGMAELVGVLRMDLGRTLFLSGDFEGARVLFERAVDDALQVAPEDSPSVQRARGNLAIALQVLGDHTQARVIQERVLESMQRTLPPDSRDVQYARIGLANTLIHLREHDSAAALLEKADEAFERTLPDDDEDRGFVLDTMSRLLRIRGDLAAAEELAQRKLEIVLKTAPAGSETLYYARELLAKTYLQRDKFEPAYELMEAAAADLATTHDPGLQLSLQADALLAECAAHAGQEERARELALSVATRLRELMRTSVLTRAPRQFEQLLQKVEMPVRVVIMLAYSVDEDGELDRAAFTVAETMRGAALRRARLLQGAAGGAEEQALRARVAEASAEVVRRAQDPKAGPIAEAVRAKERVEAELSAELAGSATETAAWSTDLAHEISARLAPDQAAVAFRICGNGARGRLSAWVLRRGEAPARVDLGGLAPFRQAVDRWRDALRARRERGLAVDLESNPEPDAGRALRRIVLDPLLPAIDDARRLVVTMDGELHSIPIDALPQDRTGDEGPEPERVGDRFAVELRPTLWQLIDPLPALASAPELVVLGGIEYDAVEDEAAAQEATAAARSRSRAEPAASAWKREYLPLPETLAEARTIDLLFEKSFGEAAQAQLLQGVEATRDALVLRAPRARFLHVATHGFFAPESVSSGEPGGVVDATLPELRGISRSEQALGLSPLVVCGLALTGANLPPDEHGRLAGIVTGEEIAALDLRACELAVLSACDTGEGSSRGAGQGLASLQQALQLAGARAVITSLWKVPDEATRELMTDFYRRLWVEKKPAGRALWEAKQRLRDKVDAKGRRVYAPRDWAGWVLSVSS